MTRSIHTHLAGIGFLIGALAITVFAGPALATTSSGTLAVSANINNSCNVVTGSLLISNSGSYIVTGLGTDSLGSATISASCTKGTTIGFIQLDRGANATGCPSACVRNLKLGSNVVPYTLCSDSSACLIPWGDTIGNTDGLGHYFTPASGNVSTSDIVPMTFTVYGLILSEDDDVPAGTYTDIVNVTVSY